MRVLTPPKKSNVKVNPAAKLAKKTASSMIGGAAMGSGVSSKTIRAPRTALNAKTIRQPLNGAAQPQRTLGELKKKPRVTAPGGRTRNSVR